MKNIFSISRDIFQQSSAFPHGVDHFSKFSGNKCKGLQKDLGTLPFNDTRNKMFVGREGGGVEGWRVEGGYW